MGNTSPRQPLATDLAQQNQSHFEQNQPTNPQVRRVNSKQQLDAIRVIRDSIRKYPENI